jgi:hypothetical protein
MATSFRLPTNNDQIAEDLKATIENSNAKLASAITASFSKPADTPIRETSNLGSINFGLFRERLRTTICRPSKVDSRA